MFPGRCYKISNLPQPLGISKKGDFLSDIHFSISETKQTVNTRQVATSHEFPGINSLSQLMAQNFFFDFLSSRSLFNVLIPYLNENRYRLNNHFEGTIRKHYSCELFFPDITCPIIKISSILRVFMG